MKRFLFSIAFILITTFHSFSQCTSDFIFTSFGVPGVYPPSVTIPGVPLPMGISDGQIGSNYNETLTVIILEDTSLDIAFLLPSSAVTAMNLAGISTVMTLDVNHVSFDVQGLPSGISYQCDQSNCQYPSSIDGCIQLSGIPMQSGNFSVPVSMTINVQIPAITDPLFGTVIFPSTAMDIPTFTANEYDLYVADGTTNIENHFIDNFISIYDPKEIRVFNTLGSEVFYGTYSSSIGIPKLDFGSGIFFIEISNKKDKYIQKIIIQ